MRLRQRGAFFTFRKERPLTLLIDLTGQRFGRLTVLRRGSYNRGGLPVWVCRCDCKPDKEIEVTGAALRRGQTRSCSCLRADASRSRGRDLTGRKFGRWTVLHQVPNHGRGRYWLCECSCPAKTRKEVSGHNLRSGQTRSCNCLRVEVARTVNLKHGHARTKRHTREYRSWYDAKVRCTYPRAIGYRNYGGRGIKMCERWLHNFSAFLADMGPCPEGCSIDRINVNGDYEPGNCRWATQAEQARGRRNNHYLEHAGERLVLTDWASRLGMTPQELHRKLQQGYTLADLFAQVELPLAA